MKTCRHCHQPIHKWDGKEKSFWVHFNTGDITCHATTHAEPQEET